MAIPMNELVDSRSGHLLDYIWPLSVRIEYPLGRIFRVLVYFPNHPIAHPKLPHMHLMVVIAGHPLLVGGRPFYASSLFSVSQSKFKHIRSLFSCSSKCLIRCVVTLISASMTASCPKARANEVSQVVILCDVLYAYNTPGSSSTMHPFFFLLV